MLKSLSRLWLAASLPAPLDDASVARLTAVIDIGLLTAVVFGVLLLLLSTVCVIGCTLPLEPERFRFAAAAAAAAAATAEEERAPILAVVIPAETVLLRDNTARSLVGLIERDTPDNDDDNDKDEEEQMEGDRVDFASDFAAALLARAMAVLAAAAAAALAAVWSGNSYGSRGSDGREATVG